MRCLLQCKPLCMPIKAYLVGVLLRHAETHVPLCQLVDMVDMVDMEVIRIMAADIIQADEDSDVCYYRLLV